MKRQKSTTFANKNSNINTLLIKVIVNLKIIDHCHYTGKDRAAAYSICNFKFSIHKENPVVFHNGPNYDYHFIVKQFSKSLKNSVVQKKVLKNTKPFQVQ